ncbi:hypothetical protein EXS62_01875 [Candidatus Kaiserbacteria bacterium]|nr:hypothetical protein [Candidatus Kaiserbacteria bacterium]
MELVGKTPIEEYYTAARLQGIITWRKKNQGKSLCKGFCKHHGTEHCPRHGDLPKKGYCPAFLFDAQTFEGAQDLIAADAKRSGITLQTFLRAS